MDHLLSLSQAARMVGVRRNTLQQQIQDGEISAFEGSIRMSELLKIYPEASPDQSGMVEKMQRIQDGALYKPNMDDLPDSRTLAAEVHRLRLELGETRVRLQGYRSLAGEMRDRLYQLQKQCDHKQAMLLGSVITWLARQINRQK